MSRRAHTTYEPRALTPEDRAIWQNAFDEAEADERNIERALAALRIEEKAQRAEIHRRREALKAELRDVIRVKKSAAFALHTGRDPQ